MGADYRRAAPAMRRRRRVWSSLGVPLLLAARVFADEPALPAKIQALLISKFAAYDRTLPGLRDGKIVVGILTHDDDAESAKMGAQVEEELESTRTIAELPHLEVAVAWTTPTALVQVCRANNVSILYVAPGFESDIAAITSALGNAPILTVGANAAYVPKGVVLGFDMVSGRPK